MSQKLELSGQRFGRLLVLCEAGRTKQKGVLWKCFCDCGKKIIVSGNSLSGRKTKSCGCLQKEKCIEASTTHGLRYTPEYRVWTLMKNRCLNKNANNYKYYGGRGIAVCNRWLKFENFFKDMGKRPNPKFTIERVNNNKGYSLSNCIWATKKTQARNRRLSKKNTSGTQGVNWHKIWNKYQVRIRVKGKDVFLGYFQNIAEAIVARKEGEIKYWEKTI